MNREQSICPARGLRSRCLQADASRAPRRRPTAGSCRSSWQRPWAGIAFVLLQAREGDRRFPPALAVLVPIHCWALFHVTSPIPALKLDATPPQFSQKENGGLHKLKATRVLSSYLKNVFMGLNQRWYLPWERGCLCRGAGPGSFGTRCRVLVRPFSRSGPPRGTCPACRLCPP